MINKNFVQFLGNIKIDKNELTFVNNEYKITISITIPTLNNKKGTASGLLTTQGFNYS